MQLTRPRLVVCESMIEALIAIQTMHTEQTLLVKVYQPRELS